MNGGQRALHQLLGNREASPDAAGGSGDVGADARSSATEAGQAILVEVRGLFESRPVSRILQSSSFRTELETLVRSSLTPRRQQQQQQQRQQQQQQQEQRPAVSADATPANVPAPAPDSSAISESELRRMRHEEFVEEISELLHSQLVTNTLSSGFRSRLERSVRLRAEALQDGGRAAVETLSSLPPSNIVRNDFSHLGIVPPDQQSVSAGSEQLLDDAVSVVSAAAAAAVATTTTTDPAGVGRQLRQVQKELSDMRRMMKALLGGQLETQRMIRQEIGAALGGQWPTEPGRPADAEGKCLICLRAGADTAVYRCGHLCLCSACGVELRQRSGRPTCPVCRAPIADMLRVYNSGVAADEE